MRSRDRRMTCALGNRLPRGFTLLEVFVATALLGLFMVLYLDSLTRSPDRANRAKLSSVATLLARAKLVEVEAELLKDRWEEFDDEECGDFTDEEYGGMDRYRWCVAIQKIELPDSVDVDGVVSRMMGLSEGEDGEEAKSSGSGAAANPMGNLLGMWMGGMAGLGGAQPGAGGTAGAAAPGATSSPITSLLASFIAPFRAVVEQAIRRVTVRVYWTYRGKEEGVTLLYYITRPDLVDQAIIGGFLQSGAAGGGQQPGGSGTGGGKTK